MSGSHQPSGLEGLNTPREVSVKPMAESDLLRAKALWKEVFAYVKPLSPLSSPLSDVFKISQPELDLMFTGWDEIIKKAQEEQNSSPQGSDFLWEAASFFIKEASLLHMDPREQAAAFVSRFTGERVAAYKKLFETFLMEPPSGYSNIKNHFKALKIKTQAINCYPECMESLFNLIDTKCIFILNEQKDRIYRDYGEFPRCLDKEYTQTYSGNRAGILCKTIDEIKEAQRQERLECIARCATCLAGQSAVDLGSLELDAKRKYLDKIECILRANLIKNQPLNKHQIFFTKLYRLCINAIRLIPVLGWGIGIYKKYKTKTGSFFCDFLTTSQREANKAHQLIMKERKGLGSEQQEPSTPPTPVTPRPFGAASG